MTRWAAFKHWLQPRLGLNHCRAISRNVGGFFQHNHECVVCGKRGEWFEIDPRFLDE